MEMRKYRYRLQQAGILVNQLLKEQNKVRSKFYKHKVNGNTNHDQSNSHWLLTTLVLNRSTKGV